MVELHAWHPLSGYGKLNAGAGEGSSRRGQPLCPRAVLAGPLGREDADENSRNAWIRDVRTALEADGIGWAMWDYRGSFGVVFKEQGTTARPDPATVEALGLKKE